MIDGYHQKKSYFHVKSIQNGPHNLQEVVDQLKFPDLLMVPSEKPEEQPIIKVVVTGHQVIGCFNVCMVIYPKEHDA